MQHKTALAIAALNTGPAGTSASPYSERSFRLLFPMHILCTIHSLNGSHIPAAISLPTTDIHQRTDHQEGKTASVCFFLDGFLANRQTV